MQILQVCLVELLEQIIIPHSGWTRSHPASVTFQAHPEVRKWSGELKNALGKKEKGTVYMGDVHVLWFRERERERDAHAHRPCSCGMKNKYNVGC